MENDSCLKKILAVGIWRWQQLVLAIPHQLVISAIQELYSSITESPNLAVATVSVFMTELSPACGRCIPVFLFS